MPPLAQPTIAAPSGVWTCWIVPPSPETGRFRQRCNIMHMDATGHHVMFEFDVGRDRRNPTRYNIDDPALVAKLEQQRQFAEPSHLSPHFETPESPKVFVIMDSVDAKKQAEITRFKAMVGTSERPVSVGGAPDAGAPQNPGDVIFALVEQNKMLAAQIAALTALVTGAPTPAALPAESSPEPIMAVGRRIEDPEAVPEPPAKPVTVTTAGEMSEAELERATAPSAPGRTGKR